jgi:hypothetical protein
MVGEDATLGTVLADAGYWSDANAATEDGGLRAADRHPKRPPAARRHARGSTATRLDAQQLTARQRMDRKLRTKPGRALYRRPKSGSSSEQRLEPDLVRLAVSFMRKRSSRGGTQLYVWTCRSTYRVPNG